MIRPPNRVELLKLIPKGGVCAEIGVFRGEFAQWIADIVQPSVLYLIDPWESPMGWFLDGEWMNCPGEESLQIVRAKFAADGRVVIIRDSSPGALPGIPPLDFAYIDGDHHYESVLADLEAVLPRMNPGGWICGHDYCEIFDHAVPRAVSEFCSRYGLRIDILTDEPKNPTRDRTGINASVPGMVAYNSFGVQVK
jgi:hypothetical protein